MNIVSSFTHQYPTCQVLVTSRVIGYDDASLPDEFSVFKLNRFTEENIKDYVTKFMRVISNYTLDEAKERALLFLKETNNHAKDIRTNPLMLGLMSSIFNIRGSVPSNRPEIYQECAILMFERWDNNRDIRAEIPNDFDLLDLFSSIAAKLFDSKTKLGEFEVSKDWLQAEIFSYFNKLYESRSKATRASKQLVSFVTGRAWVMADFGENSYRFTHQTFLEYFFAKHLDNQYDTIKELFKKIKPKIRQRKWEVVAPLALQLKSFRNHRKIDEALEECIKMLGSELRISSRKKHSEVLFVSDALTYLPGSEAQTRKLYRLALEESLVTIIHTKQDQPTAAYLDLNHPEYQAENSFLEIAVAFVRCHERKDILRDELRNFLVENILSDDPVRSTSALSTVYRHWSHIPNINAYIAKKSLHSLDPELGTNILSSCKETLYQYSKTSKEFSHTYITIYGENISELIKIHGSHCLFPQKKPKDIFNITDLLLDHFGCAIIESFSRNPQTSAIQILKATNQLPHVEIGQKLKSEISHYLHFSDFRDKSLHDLALEKEQLLGILYSIDLLISGDYWKDKLDKNHQLYHLKRRLMNEAQSLYGWDLSDL